MRTATLLILLLLAPLAIALDADSYQVVLGDGDKETLSDDFSDQLVTTPAGGPLLVIGGPCANDLWERYADIACREWPFSEGQGMIFSHDDGNIILIGGTTQEDTERMVTQFLGTVTTDRQAVSDDTSDVDDEFTLIEGESRTLRLVDGSITVSGLDVTDDEAEIIIDGERYTGLTAGETVTTDDRIIEIIDVGTGGITMSVSDSFESNDDNDDDGTEVTVDEGETESVNVDGDWFGIENLSIDDGEVDVTIDGERFTNLGEGDTESVGDVEFELTDVSDDAATFSFSDDASGLDEGDEITLDDGDDQEVEIDGETIDFEDVNIDEDTLDVTVDGSAYNDLVVGNAITANGVTFSVTDISEDEAELNIDEID